MNTKLIMFPKLNRLLCMAAACGAPCTRHGASASPTKEIHNISRRLAIVLLAVVGVATVGATVPSYYDDFETNLYVEGVMLATNGWQASGAAAYVTNSGGLGESRAAVMGESVTLTNSQTASANLKVWTDFQMKPILGGEFTSPPTNTASLFFYFDSNGVVEVASPSGWLVCTNDIWGSPVPPATNNVYVRVSVFQDYNTSNQAVLLNDQLILQDLRFVGMAGNFNRLVVQNTDSNCWLDNVWIKTNVTGLASNRNNDAEGLAEADELQRYGYAKRTLYVTGGGIPAYPTLQAALNASRPRDSIWVNAGTYAESVTITTNVSFEGQGFSVNNLTVALGATVSFAQSVNCLGTFALTGQVAMASGASVTADTVNVIGSLSVSTNGALVATNLSVGGSGLITFTTNSQLVAVTAGVTMNGPLAISNNTWGVVSVASMPLPFSDTFDLYADDTLMTNLKFRGWNASEATVKVQSIVKNSGKAVVLPDGTVLSNRINSASVNFTTTKVWSDFFIRPVLGIQPMTLETNKSSFLAYADTNGYLVVAIAGGGWHVCSNQLDGAQPTLLQTNAFARITVCQDFSASPPTFAVFVASNLVAQGLSAPANINAYSSLIANNWDGSAYVDDVLITTVIPPGLASDLDHDGMADAYEINNYGITSMMPIGTVYKFR